MPTTKKNENFQALRAYKNQMFFYCFSKPPKRSTFEFWLLKEASFAPPGDFQKFRSSQGGVKEALWRGPKKLLRDQEAPEPIKSNVFLIFLKSK